MLFFRYISFAMKWHCSMSLFRPFHPYCELWHRFTRRFAYFYISYERERVCIEKRVLCALQEYILCHLGLSKQQFADLRIHSKVMSQQSTYKPPKVVCTPAFSWKSPAMHLHDIKLITQNESHKCAYYNTSSHFWIRT